MASVWVSRHSGDVFALVGRCCVYFGSQIIRDIQLMGLVALLILVDMLILTTWYLTDPSRCSRSVAAVVKVQSAANCFYGWFFVFFGKGEKHIVKQDDDQRSDMQKL